MYSASKREVGEYSDRVRLEVKTEFFSSHPNSQLSRTYCVGVRDRG